MFETYEAVCKEINNYPKKTETSNIIKFKYNNKEIVNKLYNIICNNNIEIFMPLEEKPYGSIELSFPLIKVVDIFYNRSMLNSFEPLWFVFYC